MILKKLLAERSFDLRTSGLWAQHASTAPLCYSDKSNRQRSTSNSSSSSSSSKTEKADRLSRQFLSTIRSSVVMTPLVSFLQAVQAHGCLAVCAPPLPQGQVRAKLDVLLCLVLQSKP